MEPVLARARYLAASLAHALAKESEAAMSKTQRRAFQSIFSRQEVRQVPNGGCGEHHNRHHHEPGDKPRLQPVRDERPPYQKRVARNRRRDRAGQTGLNESEDEVAKSARYPQHAG